MQQMILDSDTLHTYAVPGSIGTTHGSDQCFLGHREAPLALENDRED